MTDYEARLKIYNRLCNENDKEKWLSRDYLLGELKMTEDEYNRAVDWMSPISGRKEVRMIIDTADAGDLRLGPTGCRWCEDRTEPELSN